VAGDALRSILERSVRGPISGMFWGGGITAVTQSSSATTLMTIGFVSAGLLTYSQSIGVIFGANLGTTSTGWIVSVVGLQVKMTVVALPLVGVGALVRLIGGERWAALGIALAGLGLIFIGIDTLQAGMAGLAERIDPASFPGMTIVGVPLLIITGAVMTVVMQSSSAAVATTLTALHAEAISFEQAAVLVIGQNIGTTVKAALAALGASTPAKRTAVAHILFNGVAAALALMLLPLYLMVMSAFTSGHAEGDARGHAAMWLAGYHTAFNILGVLVCLPFTQPFSRLVMRLVPERGPALSRYLDPSVLNVPSVAVEAARRTLLAIARELASTLDQRFEHELSRPAAVSRVRDVEQALAEAQVFLSRLASAAGPSAVFARQLGCVHATDHLLRLADAARADRAVHVLEQRDELRKAVGQLRSMLAAVRAWGDDRADDAGMAAMAEATVGIARARREQRARLLEEIAAGRIRPRESAKLLEGLLWLDRLGYHLWRAMHHLKSTVTPSPGHEPLLPEPQ
jgi:phosphate:Na+ symporter